MQDHHPRRQNTTAPSTLYRLPALSLRASHNQRLTPDERSRKRNQEPQEVFRETSKEMRLISVHHHKAPVPLQVVQHQKRLSQSRGGGNLIGELWTWGGKMDDGLRVRFVPARVAELYTAANAMEPKFRCVYEGRQEQRKHRQRARCVSRGAMEGEPKSTVGASESDKRRDAESLPRSGRDGTAGSWGDGRVSTLDEKQPTSKRLQRKLALTPGLSRHKQQVVSALAFVAAILRSPGQA